MSTTHQLVSFAIVGIVSNASLYALYLVLTGAGVGHKMAMTLAFVAGVAWSYALNRRWTFRHTGALGDSALRYVGVYLGAYVANICALVLLVDLAHFAHETVMLALIVVTATLMFALQKWWVFEQRPAPLVTSRETGQ